MSRTYTFQTGKDSRGFTLIEVFIAIVILSVGFLGLSAMTIAAIRSLSLSKNRTIATTMAQNNIEDIKNTSYTNVTTANYPTEDYGTIPGYPQFRRIITIDTNNPVANTKTIVVTVSWKDQSGTSHNVILSTIISR